MGERPELGDTDVKSRIAFRLYVVLWLCTAAATARAATGVGVLDGDVRLSRSIQLQERHIPLDDALRRVAEPAGVLLKADGEAADLRVTVFVSGVPLRAFMM